MGDSMLSRIGVCMVTYALPPDHSGAAKQAITLASELISNHGVDIFFITQGNTQKSQFEKYVSGFRVIRIYKESLFWKILAPVRFFITFFIERNNYSVIHVHGVGYLGKIAVLFGKLFNKPVILKMTMFTEDDAMSIKRSSWFDFWFFTKATRYIAITRSFLESCLQAGVPERKIVLIPNGVDTGRFKPISTTEKKKQREKLGLPCDKTILVYAGIIRPEKGIDFLLDALQLIVRERSDVYLLVLGPLESWLPEEERQYAEAVVRRMAAPELKDFVRYGGKVDNVHEFFQVADIFVSASKREGFPNVLLEAMSAGLPPVVVNIPGIHERILQNGVNGIVVSKPDVSNFVLKVLMVVDDVHFRQILSSSALATIGQHYSISAIADRYQELYTELCDSVI